MSAISTIRHHEIFNARENNHPITIIGAGAIGSRVFAALVELGLNKIQVIDFDHVEEHNLANQIFSSKDVGAPKVVACRSWYEQKTGTVAPESLQLHVAKLPDPNYPILGGSVFLLTDSMASRRQIFEEVLANNLDVYRIIEVRMASTHGNVYMFDPNVPRDAEAWLNTLIDDDTAEVSACGSTLSVGTTASILANLAVWQFMHAKTDPAATDSAIDVYLKPLCIHTRKLTDEQ